MLPSFLLYYEDTTLVLGVWSWCFWKVAIELMHMGTRLSKILLLFALFEQEAYALVVPNHTCTTLQRFS